MIESVGTVAVVVSNAKKPAASYKEKLGFEIRDQDGHWGTVAPKKSETLLHLCKQKELEPGNTGIALYAKDIETTYADLVKKGVPFRHKLTHADWGTFAMLIDPDGNEFWLVPSE